MSPNVSDKAAKANSPGVDTPRTLTEDPTTTPKSGSVKDQPLVPTLEDDESPVPPQRVLPAVDIPLRYRITALVLILLFSNGASFAESVLIPLKSTLRKELHINNAQYGVISSASSLVNTILPIIGGIGMDHWGATYAAMFAAFFIMVGTLVAAPAANTEHYQLLIAGSVIRGMGMTIINSAGSKLYAHWFQGSWLGFVFGVDMAWGRICNLIAKATAVPMSDINGWWGWALWIPTIVSIVSFAMSVGYWWYERSVPFKYRPPLGKDAYQVEGWRKRKFGLKTVSQLPMFLWILCATQIFQNGATGVYSHNLADIQSKTRGTSKLAAGYNTSLQGIIPIVLTPVTGLFFDKIGFRMIFVSFTGLLYVIVFSLIGFTNVHPLCPILISSFALTTNAIAFIASIPVIVGNDALLGTGYGVWKTFQNCNQIIMEVAAGAIQDKTKDNSYDNVLYFLIAIKSIEILLGPIYDILDGKLLGHSLRMPEKRRIQFRRDVLESGEQWRGWLPSKRAATIVGCLLGSMIIVAWVLYIVYAMGT